MPTVKMHNPHVTILEKEIVKEQVAVVDASNLSDNHIAPDAAIAHSKLAPLPSSQVLVSDDKGVISASKVTPDELNHLSGVQAPVQEQLDKLGSSLKACSHATDALIEMVVTNREKSEPVLKLADIVTIEKPEIGMIAFDYKKGILKVYDGKKWAKPKTRLF